MLETVYVHCTHCGYDNSPEYRFCGMCGASLAHPPVASKPAEKPAPANGGNGSEKVHGPSFLGLADDPKAEFHYLYEDEQPRSHIALLVFIVILIAAGAGLGWQWRHGGYPFNRGIGGLFSQSSSPSSSEVSPAQSPDQQTHIDKPLTGAGDVLPTQPDQKGQAETEGKTTEIPVENGKSATSTNPPASTASSAAPAQPSAGDNENPPAQEKAAENKPPEQAQEAKATPPAEVPAKPRAIKPATRGAKSAASQAETSTAPTSPDADLELAGERYLYGNGLPQNCSRAESNLRTAANKGNLKAQTVLGTMYATGHCVDRDLPIAYRWFARALHQEPQNARIADDLQVLWRQMSPQEKQLAMASGQ
jgi:zinc-ribbon domain/Sel1 repeat